MTTRALVSPTHRSVRRYYETLEALKNQSVDNEMSVRSAFEFLLAETAKLRGWTLVPELSEKSGGSLMRPDGTLRDANSLPRGYWEAKDTKDDLNAEIRRKIARGYPLSNTIFEDTQTGVLYQNKREVLRVPLSDPKELTRLLNQFFGYAEPDIEGFEEAVEEFQESVPELARGLAEKIREAHEDNPRFIQAFAQFFNLCETALNPNIRVEAVDEMLVQHLLTERLFRTIFDNPEFTRRNAIAQEVERVIDALLSQSFNRSDYLKGLDRFYLAIESAARILPDFSEKQHFLNTIYERFFQGYSVKVADTMGIVYTPQPIVDFMCASVAEVLEKEFGKSLSSPDVFIIDPCTGTGNFIVNLLRRISKRDLPRMYREQFFANEVMLMPYYIAALNIEHAYYELTGTYEPFEGLCFVDTLELAEGSQHQLGFMTEKNAERVERQKRAPITVVIGNPPYNVGQINENDNNKNRKYPLIESRVSETYAKGSKASNKNALSDPYVKFFRWATDRLQGRDGIVAFVTNNRFVRGVAFDGFRKSVASEFTEVYHFDLRGDARTTGELRRQEAGNIFHDQIRVGVGITLLVRNKRATHPMLHYHVVPPYWKSLQKSEHLSSFRHVGRVAWRDSTPDLRGDWLVPANAEQYADFIPIASKEAKSGQSASPETIFKLFSRGVATSRDEVVYDFQNKALISRVRRFVEEYNGEVDRHRRSGKKTPIDDFVRYDKIKWSRDLKLDLKRGSYASFDDSKLRRCLYRPFCRRWLFFDRILNEEVYVNPRMFPNNQSERDNCAIVTSDIAYRSLSPSVLATHVITDLHLCASDSHQCFPFYVYSEDGTNRRENITDWAIEQFRNHYGDNKITKWDIFYYVYGVLHHPEYRAKYAENLKRELPRIPLAKDFRAFADAGKELAQLHIDYEKLEPYPLKFLENKDLPLSYRVEDKMRLSKDRQSLKVNDSLTLAGIPPETFEYRLGNRSALEWVIDQYQVTEDKHSGIRSDPNRPDDPEYIVRLVGQVIRVSLETVRIVGAINALPLAS